MPGKFREKLEQRERERELGKTRSVKGRENMK